MNLFSKLISNSKPTNRLQKLSIYISVFGGITSLLLAIWSIILTIYYKDSIEKVEDLDKVIKELRTQSNFQRNQISELSEIANKSTDIDRRLLELNSASNDENRILTENNKPLLKDVSYTFNKLPGITSPKFEFDLILKNYGGRPAYRVNLRAIFLKLNDEKTKILSHGTQSFSKDKLYQETISPYETKDYKQINNFSQNGFNDLNSLILVINLTYFDAVTKKFETVNYYYTHKYNDKNNQLIISTADFQLKKMAISYLKSNKI